MHRDVKPANIRITTDDKPLLLDFGIAHDMSSDMATLTRSFAGSPTYAAPEQIAQGPVDGRTDVYALGVTLYQCLTGVVPFSADTIEGIFHRVLHEDATPPRRLRQTVARELEVVTLKAMEKDPAARYQSAAEFADDLDAILQYRPIYARPPGPVARFYKWSRRKPARAVALAAVVVLIVALAVGLPLAAAAERRNQARGLVDEAHRRVEAYRALSTRAREVENRIARLEKEQQRRYFTREEDQRLLESQAGMAKARLDRDGAFYNVLELLERAELLDRDVGGGDAVRAELYYERWDEARLRRDSYDQMLYRRAVERYDHDGKFKDRFVRRLQLVITSDPPADCYLFRYRELRELYELGPRRQVPVPLGGEDPPVKYGTWVLRVVKGAGNVVPGDLILELAGHPVQDTVFDEDGQRIQGFAGPTDLEEADKVGYTPAQLAARGGVEALVYHLGETRREVLAPGIVSRMTAAPVFASPGCMIGRTPVTAKQLANGDYLVLLRREGYEDLICATGLSDTKRLDLKLLPTGTTPVGWVHVPSDYRGPGFWMMEREVTTAEYLEFLNSPEILHEIEPDQRTLIPRDPSTNYWEGHRGKPFTLPDDWTLDQPVVGVSWDDAQEYVAWASKRDGRNYALPTELEWNRAAGERGLARNYPFGNVFLPKWVSSNWSRKRAFLEPVMRYPIDESPLGMYDASGSAFEWLDAIWGSDKSMRWMAGGAWGHSNPEMFRITGGQGAKPFARDGHLRLPHGVAPVKLPELLIEHRVKLLRYIERNAGMLLRFETSDDLVQGIHLRALKYGDDFEYRGVEPFFAWLFEVAKSHFKERREHWMALKRKPARLFRLTQAAATSDPGAVAEPPGSGTGPSTFAARREQLNLAVKALAMLMPRDRDLVRWMTEGVDDTEIGRRLGMEPRSAARARQRAVERFQRAHRLLNQRR